MSAVPTVSELLFGGKPLSQDQFVRIEAADSLKQARTHVGKRVFPSYWAGVRGLFDKEIKRIQNVTVVDAVAAGFQKAGELLEYADPEKHPPAEVADVPLGEVSIEHDQEFGLEVTVGGRSMGQVDFNLHLEMTFSGLVLQVRGGRIWSTRAGACSASASLSCEKQTVAKSQTRSFVLDPPFLFPAGIPIAPWRETAATRATPAATIDVSVPQP